MAEAEQYLSCESLMARSTMLGFRPWPLTVNWKWMRVKTFGSVCARSATSFTSQPRISWPLLRRITTTS